MKKIVLFLIIFLFLCGWELTSSVDEIFITDYLNNKYGEDIEFTPMYMSSCKIYENGTCRASFTASDTGDNEIHIIWTKKDGSDMKDDYLFLKYDKQLKSYYTNLIKNVTSNKFVINEISNKSDYKWEKNLSFDEFIKYENLNSGLSINIANSSVDLNKFAESIKNYFNSKKINNVASLFITSYNNGCDLNNTNNCKKANSIYYEVKIVEFFDENAKKS